MEEEQRDDLEVRRVLALEKLAFCAERTADANEKLNELATEERESGDSLRAPPYCPHCGHLDPLIRNEGGTGQFGEFVLVAYCGNCSKTFFGVTENWQLFKTQKELQERAEQNESSS